MKKRITLPPPSRAAQNKLARAMRSMQQEITKEVENQLGALSGPRNAAMILRFSYNAESRIRERFSRDRIQQATGAVLDVMTATGADKLAALAGGGFAIDANAINRDEDVRNAISASREQFLQWAEGLRDETLQRCINAVSSMLSQGKTIAQMRKELSAMSEAREKGIINATRTQTAIVHSVVNKARAEAAGVQSAVWVTLGDERVRPSHQDRNGKQFDLSRGLYSSKDDKWLLPGVDHNCRCTYQFVLDD